MRILIYQSDALVGALFSMQRIETGMDRLFANNTVNAAELGLGSSQTPALFLFHSLLSDRASFDTIVAKLARRNRVIVPELPGFGRSKAVSGGLAAVADRMAEAVKDAAGGRETIVLGNGYGGFVALQMAIRHPGLADKLVLADCGAAFSESGREAFRNMPAPRRPTDFRRSRTWQCGGCSRRNFRHPIRS
jgi:3-oxoadipate enol-lactonase